MLSDFLNNITLLARITITSTDYIQPQHTLKTTESTDYHNKYQHKLNMRDIHSHWDPYNSPHGFRPADFDQVRFSDIKQDFETEIANPRPAPVLPLDKIHHTAEWLRQEVIADNINLPGGRQMPLELWDMIFNYMKQGEKQYALARVIALQESPEHNIIHCQLYNSPLGEYQYERYRPIKDDPKALIPAKRKFNEPRTLKPVKEIFNKITTGALNVPYTGATATSILPLFLNKNEEDSRLQNNAAHLYNGNKLAHVLMIMACSFGPCTSCNGLDFHAVMDPTKAIRNGSWTQSLISIVTVNFIPLDRMDTASETFIRRCRKFRQDSDDHFTALKQDTRRCLCLLGYRDGIEQGRDGHFRNKRMLRWLYHMVDAKVETWADLERKHIIRSN